MRSNAVNGVVLPDMDADEPAWLSFVISRYLDEAGRLDHCLLDGYMYPDLRSFKHTSPGVD